ncbi:MAG: oxidoreductase [Sporichthyaceae bacterium]|nr:oxidoreductase [Sporichthyaceae bacterium]
MSWSAADIPDQSGRVAVVTGANGGLGLETALALAAHGAHVVLAARDQDKAVAAMARLRTTVPTASAQVVPLDLGSLASVRTFADQVGTEHPRLDLLVNNAGVMAVPEGRTEDGFEAQFGINHLGHFALTGLLLPALLRAPAARVVNVTSTARHTGRPIDPDNPHLHGRYTPWRAYGQSKLANVHFTLGLQQRLAAAAAAASCLVAHPGLSNTDLQAHSVRATEGGASQRLWHLLATRTGMSAAAGALPQLRAATDPGARGGQLYAPRYVNFGPPVRRPMLPRRGERAAIETLWAVSERETGVTIDVPGTLAQIKAD